MVKEGDEARRAVAEAGRKTTGRRELSQRHQQFDEVSPEVGELDEGRFDELLEDEPDETLALLADLTGATDEGLRDLARRLAGRILVDIARTGATRRRGVGRIESMRGATGDGDIDLDASLDAIVSARAARVALNAEDLTLRGWRRPEVALCLLVDRSGSMLGERLAAAAVTAAAVAYRHGADCSIVAFGSEAVVVKSQGEHRSPEDVVSDLLRLRGHGTTDVALALRTARTQLDRSGAGRKIAVLLSDCRPTSGGDATADAAALDELAILAPAADTADAARLAESVGARWVVLDGPSSAADAVATLLS